MDDHVHGLFRVHPDFTSMQVVAAWKSISAHRICGASSRLAPLWQRDSYQRWMRSDTQTAICAAYIEANPRRRWPRIASYPWLLP